MSRNDLKGKEKSYFSATGFDKDFPFLEQWPNDLIKDLKSLSTALSEQVELSLIHPIMLSHLILLRDNKSVHLSQWLQKVTQIIKRNSQSLFKNLESFFDEFGVSQTINPEFYKASREIAEGKILEDYGASTYFPLKTLAELNKSFLTADQILKEKKKPVSLKAMLDYIGGANRGHLVTGNARTTKNLDNLATFLKFTNQKDIRNKANHDLYETLNLEKSDRAKESSAKQAMERRVKELQEALKDFRHGPNVTPNGKIIKEPRNVSQEEVNILKRLFSALKDRTAIQQVDQEELKKWLKPIASNDVTNYLKAQQLINAVTRLSHEFKEIDFEPNYLKTESEVQFIEFSSNKKKPHYYVALKSGKLIKFHEKTNEMLECWTERQGIKGLALDRHDTLYYSTLDELKILDKKGKKVKAVKGATVYNVCSRVNLVSQGEFSKKDQVFWFAGKGQVKIVDPITYETYTINGLCQETQNLVLFEVIPKHQHILYAQQQNWFDFKEVKDKIQILNYSDGSKANIRLQNPYGISVKFETYCCAVNQRLDVVVFGHCITTNKQGIKEYPVITLHKYDTSLTLPLIHCMIVEGTAGSGIRHLCFPGQGHSVVGTDWEDSLFYCKVNLPYLEQPSIVQELAGQNEQQMISKGQARAINSMKSHGKFIYLCHDSNRISVAELNPKLLRLK